MNATSRQRIVHDEELVGTNVGRYVIEKRIGQGGMGVVFLARHPDIGRPVAIKVLSAAASPGDDLVLRFFNEARAASAIRHPNIVQVHDVGTLADGTHYIVMEHLEGESLRDRLERRGRLSVAEALDIVRQAASALAAAHDRHVIHRDLKPDNVFLVPDVHTSGGGGEQVKILDFGVAKLGGTLAGSSLTQSGLIVGTPTYMSPEQCMGNRELDARSDVYSLAVVLFEMLCGRTPFASDGAGELITMHISEPPPSPRSLGVELPPWLEGALLRALAKSPDRRPPHMRAFRDALTPRSGGYPARALRTASATVATLASMPHGRGRRLLAPVTPCEAPSVESLGPDTLGPVTLSLGKATARSWPRRLKPLPVIGGIVALLVLIARPAPKTTWRGALGGAAARAATTPASATPIDAPAPIGPPAIEPPAEPAIEPQPPVPRPRKPSVRKAPLNRGVAATDRPRITIKTER